MGTLRSRPLGGSYKHISTATTTPVKTSSGTLRGIAVNTTAAGTITINDNLGTIGILKASIAEGFYAFDVTCVGKIEIVTGAASDITVVYD